MKAVDQTLPRKRRLRKRKDFQRTERQGVRQSGKSAVILCKKGSGRLGLTVSAKVGNSVVRNLIKRQLRDIMRKVKDSWKDLDLVIIALPIAPTLSFEELRTDILRLLKKASK